MEKYLSPEDIAMAHKKYLSQMRSASWKAVFCRVLPRFAGQKKLLIICDSVMEKAKYGKMLQVNAVNGSQMVVKLRGSYYRRGKEIMRVKLESISPDY